MSNGAAAIIAALAILLSGSLITGAQAGSAQSSAPSKYNGHSNYSSTPVVWTGQNVGITEFSSSSARAARHGPKR
jgi:hypothetical protein